MSIITDIIGKLGNAAGGGILDGASKIISNFVEDPTKKGEAIAEIEKLKITHEEVMVKMANEVDAAYLADVADSRAMNTKIQESANASWLSKNVAYFIDIFLILVFSAMLVIIIYKQVPNENKELFYTAFGLLGGYVGSVINYHRGSSSGSKAKSDSINKMMDK